MEAKESETNAVCDYRDQLHQALGNQTGTICAADAFLICGLEASKAGQSQLQFFGQAIRGLGWERTRRRFDGELMYAYVKGTVLEREVRLAVEYDRHTRGVCVKREGGQLPSSAPWSTADACRDELHRLLGNRTGKILVSDVCIICGIDRDKANHYQLKRICFAIRALGWERQRRRFYSYGGLQYGYVKGTAAQRLTELTVEYDPHMRCTTVVVVNGACSTAEN